MVSHMMYLMIFTLICSLNPYCSGRWSRTHDEFNKRVEKYVLILIVVDNGLVRRVAWNATRKALVLILIIVDNGLVLDLIRLY